MKKFNPEKELKKIQKGNKNKIIISVIALLLVIAIGSSYALYQVRYSKRIIYTKVGDFSRDLNLAVFVDGVKQKTFPEKSNSMIYTKTDCNDNNVSASWDYNDWSLVIESKLPNKCNVYFETRWKDTSGAAYPELYQGLIPITIGSNGEIKVADLSQRWYNYDEHEWANAVLVTNEAYQRIVKEDGTFKTDETISLDTDILQMYVWIPRYRYKLWNVLNENSNPFAIEIEFENNTKGRSLGQTNGEWLTHPAFLFGETELNGIWVGKFEPSDPNDPTGRTNTNISEITIIPNKTSMVNRSMKTMFDAERNIEQENNKYHLIPQEVDTHLMKNMEWGAVAYLTSSKYGRFERNGKQISSGAEVWINNTAQGTATSGTWTYGGTYTGCVGESVNASVSWGQGGASLATCLPELQWNKDGVKASTTGNMYGIYDMVGGAWEYVMGVIKVQNGDAPNWGTSGFSNNPPESKYYDLYDFSDDETSHEKGHLGDATRETLKTFGDSYGGWNDDHAYFPRITSDNAAPWFRRGGIYVDKTHAGIFAFRWQTNTNGTYSTFRSVLTAQDGIE